MTKLLRLCTLCAGFALMTASAWGADQLPTDFSVTPAPGSTVEKIETIKVTSGWVTKKGTTTQILIDGRPYNTDVADGETFESLLFTLQNPVVTNGSHLVTFPKGTFLYGWEDDESPLLEFHLTVENNIDDPENPDPGDVIINQVPEGFSVSPAAGEEVDVLNTVTVTSESHLFLSPKLNPGITINGEVYSTVHAVKGELENTITWTLAKPITEAGTYTVQIPEGAFYDLEEEDNPAFLFSVKVLGGTPGEPDLYPADVTSDPENGTTVKELKKFAVMYPKLTSVFLGPESGAVVVTRGETPVGARINMNPDEDSFNEAHVIWVELEEALTLAGTYTFSFPEQCFIVSKYPVNKYSAPFTLSFTVDPNAAISEIEADDAAAEYFTPAGVKVSAPAAPGLYIVRRGNTVTKQVIR